MLNYIIKKTIQLSKPLDKSLFSTEERKLYNLIEENFDGLKIYAGYLYALPQFKDRQKNNEVIQLNNYISYQKGSYFVFKVNDSFCILINKTDGTLKVLDYPDSFNLKKPNRNEDYPFFLCEIPCSNPVESLKFIRYFSKKCNKIIDLKIREEDSLKEKKRKEEELYTQSEKEKYQVNQLNALNKILEKI